MQTSIYANVVFVRLDVGALKEADELLSVIESRAGILHSNTVIIRRIVGDDDVDANAPPRLESEALVATKNTVVEVLGSVVAELCAGVTGLHLLHHDATLLSYRATVMESDISMETTRVEVMLQDADGALEMPQETVDVFANANGKLRILGKQLRRADALYNKVTNEIALAIKGVVPKHNAVCNPLEKFVRNIIANATGYSTLDVCNVRYPSRFAQSLRDTRCERALLDDPSSVVSFSQLVLKVHATVAKMHATIRRLNNAAVEARTDVEEAVRRAHGTSERLSRTAL
ncbi:hypothetical protein ERJ75_000437200 [Trypanosoma vivax]|uniref:Uncharacterized protein n=1 Tax=Trypanosoma vivax (strain Y486) TaxID=1055687 RepID=F9WW12_TRYVY